MKTSALLVLATLVPLATAGTPARYLDRPDAWFAGDDARRIAANILAHQADLGGWPKNVDTTKPFAGDRGDLEGTFDNRATTDELRFLARAFSATKDDRFRTAVEKGVDHILKAQYANGGWPQYHPPGRGYHRYITFNDNAMVRLMEILRETYTSDRYAFLGAGRRDAARTAFDKGVRCILTCQVVVDGKLTAWCGQHDDTDFRPRPARAFEPASLSGFESVGVVGLLMSLDNPSPEVVRAVDGAVAWFEAAKLTGIKVVVEKDPRSPKGTNKVVVKDPAAPPLWARFYEIGTNKPLFTDRDGKPKYDLSEIGYERRNGYVWHGDWPAEVLKEYPAWKAKRAQTPNPPAPFPKREGGETSKGVLGSSPPSRFGKGAGGLGSLQRPNVLLVITDDQGYGDLGCHGNPVVKTPNLDRFASQSVECTRFYVSPVCSPTRAALMTGRYNYRTGVVDTSFGRSMMRPDEVTLAALLSAAGYRTGLFGKWHLGDNYPLRPQDRGFQDVLMNRGGGLGQPSDYPGSTYYKPILERNGKVETVDRYCTDAYTDAALKFIDDAKGRPFFAYVAFNCPHAPLDPPAAVAAAYKGLDLSAAAFPKAGQPVAARAMPAEQMAKLYAMVTNVDTNIGRLLAKLDERKLADDTIVIFLTDNGPQQPRYNAGLRGLKGTVYEGGIRVPFFVRWPAGGVGGGRKVDAACAHIDVLPTVAAACGVEQPKDRTIDGTNLLPLWKGAATALPDRTLFVQWHRGDVPEKGRACAARGPRYKLVQATGQQLGRAPEPKWELFDLVDDPYEQHDLTGQKPDVAARMKSEYERWFDDVTKRGFDPPRIHLGTPHENRTRLTRQDWRGPRATDWNGPAGLGHWLVTLPTGGTFDVAVRLKGVKDGGTVRLRLGDVSANEPVPAGATGFTFRGLRLPAGDATMEAWVERGGESAGVWDVEVRRVD